MVGEKIESLYNATINMIDTFVVAQSKEQIINIVIITFGREGKLHTRYTSMKELKNKEINRFEAECMPSMESALRIAKDMIENKEETPSIIYKPYIILISVGVPNDNWENICMILQIMDVHRNVKNLQLQ